MEINDAAKELESLFLKKGAFRVISHLDSDGISSAAIITKMLTHHNQEFRLSTVKQIEDSVIEELESSKEKFKAILFLDLGVTCLEKLESLSGQIFVIDHHPAGSYTHDSKHIHVVHSTEMSASCICYLFARALGIGKEVSQLAIIGMIGDIMKPNKASAPIIVDAQESGMKLQKGLTLFSPTRPLHKALEFGSIYIPGVTGSSSGALALLREAGIEIKNNKTWRTLGDLSSEEVSRLITAILVQQANSNQEIIDNIYLTKISGQLWDSRELSTLLNACGRLGHSSTAIALLVGSQDAKEEVSSIYNEYRHHLVKALNSVERAEKIKGSYYTIINARSMIKETMIGTVVSILSRSFLYEEGTLLIGLAYRTDNKIKISARSVGKPHVDLGSILKAVISKIGGEAGGHIGAAGGLILQEQEQQFLGLLEQELITPTA
jgi:single-stranded-DNA-specific exonuclease